MIRKKINKSESFFSMIPECKGVELMRYIKKRINWRYLLTIIPVTLIIGSFIILGNVVQKAKFNEEWVKIKAGINNIADNSLDIHDTYGNNEYAMSNLAVDIVCLFGVDGMYIAQFSPGLEMVSNPAHNDFTTFNPLSYPAIKSVIVDKYKAEKNESGEVLVNYVTPGGQVRKVYTFFRWVYHVHDATDSECDYLIVVASSIESLRTHFDSSIVVTYTLLLTTISASIFYVLYVIYAYSIKQMKRDNREAQDD